MDSLEAPTISTAPFADFCRDCEGWDVEVCSGGLHPDVDGSGCHFYVEAERKVMRVTFLSRLRIQEGVLCFVVVSIDLVM